MDIFTQAERLQDYLRGFGIWAPLVFAILQLIQVVITLIPGNVVTLVGGLCFGFWQAFLISWISVTCGSLICFGIGRKLGRTALRKLLKPERFDRYEAFISNDRHKARTDVALFLMLLFPFMPDNLLCLLAGVTELKFRPFVVMVLVARPWGLASAAAFGAFGTRLPLWAIIGLLVVCGVAAFFAIRNAEKLEAFMLRLIQALRHRFGRHKGTPG